MPLEPELLHHYTDFSGLKGILETGAMWASSTYYLNDPLENRYGLSICKQTLANSFSRLKETCSHVHPESILRLIRTIDESLDEKKADKTVLRSNFCISFTEKDDEVAQWREYSNSGRGVQIAFRRSEVEKALSGGFAVESGKLMKIKTGGVKFILRSMMYGIDGEEDDDLIIAVLIDSLIEEWFEREDAQRDEAPEADFRRVAQKLANQLLVLSEALKQPGLKGEAEWRIVPTDISEELSKVVCFRGTSSLLVPYVELPLAERSWGELLPISRITVGPAIEDEMASETIALLLEASGYASQMPIIQKSRLRLR